MIPIILVSNNGRATKKFLSDFKKKHAVKPFQYFELEPKGKEFSIDQVRDIQKQIVFHASSLHVYAFHDFHTASLAAQNAFLKTLEEPPANTQFILVSDSPHALIPTIVSRAKIVDIREAQEEKDNDAENQALEEFVKTGKLDILAHPQITLEHIRDFFRRHLAKDTNAPSILKKTLEMQRLVEKNNVDPRLAVDMMVLETRRKFKSQKAKGKSIF